MQEKWYIQNQANNNKTNVTHTYTHTNKTKAVQKKKKKKERKKENTRWLKQRAKEIKDDIHQFKTELSKAQTKKQSESKVPTGK